MKQCVFYLLSLTSKKKGQKGVCTFKTNMNEFKAKRVREEDSAVKIGILSYP